MIIEILNGGEILAQDSTEYLVFADTIFVLPASQVKNTIKIKVAGVINIGLKFTYPNDNQRTIGVINGTTYKPDLHGSLVYNFTLNDQTEMELKSYKRTINTYWTPYVTEMPSSQGVLENIPINALGLVNPDNINSTDDIPEGENNLYFTEQRAVDSFTADAPITLVDGTIGTTLTQYTDEDARNAVGLALQNGTHTGISFVNADNQDKINATVSLSSFSIGNLGDVLLGGLALQNNQFLKYSNGKWINSTLSSTNLSDINTLMKKGDNLAGLTNLATARTNLGLGSASTSSTSDFLPVGSTLSSLANVTFVNLQNKNLLGYDSATGKWTNRFLASSDIQDINRIYAPINNPTFTGTAKSTEPLFNSNDNTIATTGWVKQVFAQGNFTGATQLNDLNDVQVSALQIGQVLRYDGNKFVNTKIAFTDITGTDILLKKADNLAGLSNVATARSNLGLGSASLLSDSEVLTKNSPLSDLSDVSFVNLENNQVLKYNLATNKWTNEAIKANDIDGLNGIYAPINSPILTGIPQAPTPAVNSNSTQIPTTAWVKARIAEGGGGGGGGATSLDQLTDVSINDLTQVAGQTLRFNGVEYVNAKLASSDLSNSGNIVLVNTAPTFITQAQGDNSTKVATTAFVQTAIGNVNSDTVDAIIASAGFNNDGSKPNYSSTNYILNNNSLLSAIGNLDSALFNIEASLGTASGYDVGNNNNQIPLAQDVALLGRAVNSFTGSIKIAGDGSQSLSLFNGIFPLFSVNGSGNILTEGTLQVTGTSNLSSILIQPGHTIQNLLGGQVSFGAGGLTTTGSINGHDITASGILSGNSLTVTTTSSLGTASALTPNAGNNSTRVATTEYVQNELSNFSTSLEGLSDVNLTDLLANEVLLYNGANWINSSLDINLIGGLGSVAVLDTTDVLLVVNNLSDLNDVAIARDNLGLGSSATLNAGTHAGEVLLISVNDTLPVLSGVNLTGVLKSSQAGLPNGIATLDNNGKLTSSQLPDIAITFVDVVANEEDKPAPAPENIGHVYIVTSTSKTYISDGVEWVELLSASEISIANAQAEIDRMETAIGLAINGDFIPFNDTNYLDTAETITESLTLLDTEIKANSDTLNTFGNIVTLDASSVFQVANTFNEIALDAVAQSSSRTNLGLGSSATYDAGINPNEVLLLDGNGAINSTILNLATTIGGVNIGDIITVNDTVNDLIDLPTLKTDLALASTNLTDSDNLPRLDANLNSFIGDINANSLEVTTSLASDSLTVTSTSSLAEAYATTPNPNEDSNRVATTAWVKGIVSETIGATTLDQLTDVNAPNPLANDVLLFNGTSWINSSIDISIVTGTGSSVTYDAGINANEVLLLDGNGAIDSSILNLATTIGNINIGDIVTINDTINDLIDLPTLKTDLDLSITDLNDVDITGIQGNQTIVWDGVKFIPVYTDSLLVDNQGRYIEIFDCGLVTDLTIGSSMDFQDASGTGETPLNAEDLFLNTVYFSQEDYGAIIG